MNITNLLFWLAFSALVGLLYYASLLDRDALKRALLRGISGFLAAGKGLTAWLENTPAALLGLLGRLPRLNAEPDQGETPGKWPWLEWLVIVIPISLYCLPFLNLGSPDNLPGPETEFFQSFDQILEFALKKYGQFPLWNPYYATGLPFVAHPMLHAYNPLVSLPVLLFGFLDGFRIAVLLAFIVAGLGMWWLGRELGLGPVMRIWVALMYAFSGVAAAKFIQGHYLMVLAFGWIPFSIAALLAAMRTRAKRHIAIAALGIALLFFNGNYYYAYYMLYVVAIFTLVMLFRFEEKPAGIRINFQALKVLAAIGMLAVGLIALQLLPTLEYRNQYVKDVDTQLTNSQNLQNVFLDFVSPDPFRPGGYTDSFRPEEYYAYIGWWPLIGMLLLPFAWKKRSRRDIVLLLALTLFVFAWIDVKDMPWRSLFQTVPALYQFRFPSRMVVVGATVLIAAGGLGLNSLWGFIERLGRPDPGSVLPRFLASLCALLLGAGLVWAAADVGQITRPLLQPWSYAEPRIQIIRWIRDYDSGTYYIYAPNSWDQAVIGNQMRYLNGPAALDLMPTQEQQIGNRTLLARPKYVVQSKDIPVDANATLVKSFPSVNVYRLSDSLPFAFTIGTSQLSTADNSSLTVGEVTPQAFFGPDTNSLEGVVSGSSNRVLVVLSIFTPNWQLTIDDQPAQIYNVGGFMASYVPAGKHTYRFVYRPLSFFIGLAISLASLIVIVWLLTSDRGKKTRRTEPA